MGEGVAVEEGFEMQTNANEYTKQAEDFLTAHKLTFEVALIGSDCPMFCEDQEKKREMNKVNVYPRKSHIHGKHYRCTFKRENGERFEVDFWNSYADEEFNAIGTKGYQL